MESGRRHHAELAELAELAPLGILEPQEERRLAAHLREGCERCAALYDRGIEAARVIALAAPAAEPQPESRAALLAAVAPRTDSGRATRGDGWRVAVPALAAGIALVLAAGALLVAQRAGRDVESTLLAAREQIDARIASGLGEQDARVEALLARVDRFEAGLRSGAQARARELTLSGDATSGGASARVVVDPAGNQVLLLASRLPPAPPGHTYQLWVIVSGAPSSLGVFDTDAEGRALYVDSRPLHVDDEFQVAVSVEPAGGVPQPTGPIVLASP